MEKKIVVIENGPYLVSGAIPLYEKEIVEEDGLMVLKTIRKIETDSNYVLCRCGKSNNSPFCDATHDNIDFKGLETANTEKYLDRAELVEGGRIDLYDDGRCAYARFCHKQRGDVWELVRNSDDPECYDQAIEAANQCPTGRLTINKDGELVEPDLEAEIAIVRDIPEGTCAGIFVTGNIPLISSDGHEYEVRNRYALCRCGASRTKPFCDAMHIVVNYQD